MLISLHHHFRPLSPKENKICNMIVEIYLKLNLESASRIIFYS